MNQSQTQTFQYTPLNDERQSSFRLLNILPGKGDSPVLCTLQHFPWPEETAKTGVSSSTFKIPLRNMVSHLRRRSSATDGLKRNPLSHNSRPPAYNALSYAWGIEALDRQILINGQSFVVTPTLEQAIRSLRREDQPFRVWIDAICIDQKNADEKASQINKMHRIFANAHQAVVWLGEATFDSDTAIAFAMELSENYVDGSIELFYTPILPPTLERFLSECYAPSWSALHRLFSRSWWRRAWIVQEVVVAKSVLVLCGKTSIYWRDLERAVLVTESTYSRYEIMRPVDAFIADVNMDFANLVQVRMKYVDPRLRRGSISIIDVLEYNRYRLTKLDHDRVYSILALMPKGFVDRIRIDYAQPMEELLKSVVLAIYEISGSLNILFHSQHSIRNLALPSWVPDWRRQPPVNYYYTDFQPPKRPYALFSQDLSRLSVKGARLAVVLDTHFESDLVPDICWRDLTGESWAEIFDLVVAQWSPEVLFSSNAGILNVFLKLIQAKKDPALFDPNWYSKTRYPPSSPNPQLWDTKAWEDLGNLLAKGLDGRTLVATEDFLALAAEFAQLGDVIYWIEGCSALALLRPTGNGDYTFLGDVFVGSRGPGEDQLIRELLETDTGTPAFEVITLV